ncbi:PucR family transcriptional regulator [Streptacidiphilus jiangxiensis]|uniref:PucR C-terminal helix-turn-helix domain-containing protein n=3 Tax=Streptacidiphilus jiangxiensis TaxID=235985 RepID=A0A1H7PP29_STRJI|nr:PucR family transcriptional regulator [Streptacidiphilus jiangxiensis]SEL37228.1 PucR C-terminal helix-turn-helix domain-containing protein [Streptacidiphilus jiangxiensis]
MPPLRLADLVALPELRLSVVAAPDRLDRPVEAAHVSELLRPGPWLQGGELLMTIGLLLPMTAAGCRAYVRDCAAAGASALALGLGHDLPYQEAPEVLVAAAREAGLPLLTVPDEVPFIAVTKAVFAAKAAEQHRALERAVDAQRRLTAAAASGRGLTGTLEAWVDVTGVGAVVTDLLGRPIAFAGLDPERLPDAAAELVARVASRGLRGSATSTAGPQGGPGLEVQPLGANRLRGLLVLVGALASDDRMPASGLVSLLSLELERRHLADEPERRRRSALLGRLLTEGVSPAQARDVLALAGLGGDTFRAVAVEPRPLAGAGAVTGAGEPGGRSAAGSGRGGSALLGDRSVGAVARAGAETGAGVGGGRAGSAGARERAEASAEVAADLASAAPGGLVRVREGVVEAAGDADAGIGAGVRRGVVPGASGASGARTVGAAAAEAAAELAADLALAVPGGLVRVREGLVEAVVGDDLDLGDVLARFAPGAAAGIGPAVPPEAAAGSLRQARALVAVSRALGHPAEAREARSARLLLEFGDRAALRGYADAVLGPLDAADPAGDLVRTLAIWLDTGGSWDETSRRLAVHRHTARNRVDKAMRLTGRNLDDGDDRFDLWLATRIRQGMRTSTR